MDFIKNFLKQTKGIQETDQIYQDIVDDVFNHEITSIAQSNEMIDNLNLTRDVQV